MFLLVGLAIVSDRLIFQPHPAGYDLETLAERRGRSGIFCRVPAAKLPRPACKPSAYLASPGAIAAAYLPNPEARYTLLYSHGNGEDMGDDLPILEEYRRAGFAVFAYDYNGYGASTGRAIRGCRLSRRRSGVRLADRNAAGSTAESDCVWTFAGSGRRHSSGS